MAALGNVGYIPALNENLEVKLYTICNNQLAVNVLHFQVASIAAGGARLGPMATQIDTDWATVLIPAMTADAEYRGAAVQPITTVPIAPPAWDVGAAGVGTVAGQPMPTGVCGVLKKRTTGVGRKKRGRFYIPFPAEAHNDDGLTVNAAGVTLYTDIATLIGAGHLVTDGAASSVLAPVIWNRVTGGVTLVTQVVVRSEWGRQDRRSPTGKPNLPPL